MRWVRDPTGRFSQRPHYDRGELDLECEELIGSFLRTKYGRVEYPVMTGDLCLLLEQNVDDLDVYADLGDNHFGVTEFCPGRRPKVMISRRLSEDPRMENPFRTTLTHELGHVKFHAFIWDLGEQAPRLFETKKDSGLRRECHQDRIMGAPEYDWMEWQAGYACGALLMPLTVLRAQAGSFANEKRCALPIPTAAADELVERATRNFGVSKDAARVRLTQLRYVADRDAASLSIG